jgi:hypothetical protein
MTPLISTDSPVTEFAVLLVLITHDVLSLMNNLATFSLIREISEPLSKNDVKILHPLGILIMTRKF